VAWGVVFLTDVRWCLGYGVGTRVYYNNSGGKTGAGDGHWRWTEERAVPYHDQFRRILHECDSGQDANVQRRDKKSTETSYGDEREFPRNAFCVFANNVVGDFRLPQHAH
jgi:hypothetical protein